MSHTDMGESLAALLQKSSIISRCFSEVVSSQKCPGRDRGRFSALTPGQARGQYHIRYRHR
jgi:hypothetical protein